MPAGPDGICRGVAHRGDDGRRCEHADAGNLHDPLAVGIATVPQPDPPLDLGDLLIEPANPRQQQLAERVDHHRRQALRDPLQGLGHASAHPRPTLRHHLAVFGEQAAQPVDLRGAELHKLLAHPVQRQDRLLLLALHGNGLDARHLRRRPDRPRVVLVAGCERGGDTARPTPGVFGFGPAAFPCTGSRPALPLPRLPRRAARRILARSRRRRVSRDRRPPVRADLMWSSAKPEPLLTVP